MPRIGPGLTVTTGRGETRILDQILRQDPAAEYSHARGETLFDIIEQIKTPETIIVNESTGNTAAFWRRVNFDRPGSFYFPAGGALGFGIPAAIGVKLANPSRPVVGVIGDGSANYAITGLWTAARYRIPVVFFILRNEEYAVLKWFAGVLKVGNLPGLDIPGIDYCSIAQGYGFKAARVASRDELMSVFEKALASQVPHLIEVPIQSIATPS